MMSEEDFAYRSKGPKGHPRIGLVWMTAKEASWVMRVSIRDQKATLRWALCWAFVCQAGRACGLIP